MSQHTPGPWHVGKHSRVDVYANEQQIVIPADDISFNEAKQNARLIAKAPEMHVKLARALVALSKYDYGLADSISLDVFETWQEIDRIAEEAI